ARDILLYEFPITFTGVPSRIPMRMVAPTRVRTGRRFLRALMQVNIAPRRQSSLSYWATHCSEHFHDGPRHAGDRGGLLRAVGRLRLRLRPAVRGSRHDLRLFARSAREYRPARLPDLRAAQTRAVLRA